MPDRVKIILALVFFLALLTFPVWYNVVNGKAEYKPELEVLTANVQGKDQCVMDTKYMREKHMDLLNDWREAVVRDGERVFTSSDGRKYNMSISYTCLDCHSNKEKFCDRCHNYMAVDPYCWECHITQKDANINALDFQMNEPEQTGEEVEAVMIVTEGTEMHSEIEEGH